jgi:surfeit locus 1 family protein|tara:strand:- start:1581 stop:2234 length:654 start_codon:yes stop_codon:yes gene_type:complete
VFIGFAGTACLLYLGKWQIDRLYWKLDVLKKIDQKIAAAPVLLPAEPSESVHKYLSVEISGQFLQESIRVLASKKRYGAGYRIIHVFRTNGRRLLVDLGFVGLETDYDIDLSSDISLVGNLHWPDEVDNFTPEPDLENNIWFARDVERVASALQTEPILIILKDSTLKDKNIKPMPIDTTHIPNDHLQYAITWFSLAIIWALMSCLFIWTTRQKAVK